MSRASYEQHTVYLNPLLRKHKSKQGITFEDLQAAWNRLQKHCRPSHSHPLDEMKSLHKSLLEKYNFAAETYYASFLVQYHPPSLDPDLDMGLGLGLNASFSLESYTNKAIQQLQIQEWKGDPKSIQQCFHHPLKAILAKHYKKEELKRKLQGLKDQHKQKAQERQHQNKEQQQQGLKDKKQLQANEVKKIVEEKMLQEESNNMKQEAAIADSKEHESTLVVNDEDIESSPSQEDEDEDEAGEESEEEEDNDENHGTEEEEDGERSPEEEGDTLGDIHNHTLPKDLVKKIPQNKHKRSSPIAPSPAGDAAIKRPRQNIKNNNQNHGTGHNQHQPAGQNKRKKEPTGNIGGAGAGAGAKRKKRSNRGRGRPGRGRGK